MENIEGLLKMAELKYPVGCRFKSCFEQDINTVIIHPFTYRKDKNAVQNSNGGWVWWNDKWAEVVSMPIIKEVTYEIY